MLGMKKRLLVYSTAMFMLFSVVFPGLNFPGFPGVSSFPGFPGMSFPGFPGLCACESTEESQITPSEAHLYIRDDLAKVRVVLSAIKKCKSKKQLKKLVKRAIIYTNDAGRFSQRLVEQDRAEKKCTDIITGR
jgi:hypothetical protein